MMPVVIVQALTSGQAVVAFAAVVVATLVALPALRGRDFEEAAKHASSVLLVFAVLAVLSRTLYSYGPSFGEINLVPGASISELARNRNADAIENVLGNIALFLPIGFFGIFSLRCRVWVMTAAACGLSVGIECGQLIVGGRWVDIDDVVLNSFGAFLGAAAASAGRSRVRLLQRGSRRT